MDYQEDLETILLDYFYTEGTTSTQQQQQPSENGQPLVSCTIYLQHLANPTLTVTTFSNETAQLYYQLPIAGEEGAASTAVLVSVPKNTASGGDDPNQKQQKNHTNVISAARSTLPYPET